MEEHTRRRNLEAQLEAVETRLIWAQTQLAAQRSIYRGLWKQLKETYEALDVWNDFRERQSPGSPMAE